jgi:hypothetical protein
MAIVNSACLLAESTRPYFSSPDDDNDDNLLDSRQGQGIFSSTSRQDRSPPSNGYLKLSPQA